MKRFKVTACIAEKQEFLKEDLKIAVLALAMLVCIGLMAGCMYAENPTQTVDPAQPQTDQTGTVNSKTDFTKEELLADYDSLWEMLEEDYLYFSVLEQQGLDIAALKDSTRNQLESRISDFDGFYYLLDTMFRKMQYFAHLGILEPEMLRVYETYYDSDDGNGYKKTFQNLQTQTIYAYLDGKAMNPSTAHANTSNYPQIEVSYDAQQRAVTFVIPTFSDAVLERDKDFISDYLTSLGDVEIEHIIFDISGNSGGNDRYWQNNIVSPFGGTYEWTTYLYLRDTELTRSYFFDTVHPQPVDALEDHTPPAFVRELGLTHGILSQIDLTSDAALGNHALQAKRWVIVDNRVYSSADSFAAFCKATGWATLVGQTTGGDGQGVTPVLIALPNTGLLVRFSALAAETPDGTLNAVTGITPDILVDLSKETSIDAIYRLIEEEKIP